VKRARRFYALAAAATVSASSSVFAQLRIVDYNTDAADAGTVNTGFETVFPAMAAESTNGIVRPIDIMAVTEVRTNSNAGSVATSTQDTRRFVNILNNGDRNNNTPGKYMQGTLDGNTTGGGTDGIIYNSQSVTLISEVGVGTVSTSGAARQPLRYQFRPVGYDSSADFYVYVDHYKANSDSTSMNRRNVEAQMVRSDAATLPAGSRVMYTGDFNLTGDESTSPAGPVTNEAAWQTLTSVGTGTLAANNAIDPINLGNGSFNSMNSAFVGAYTISTTQLDARFDYEFNTAPSMDGHGFSLINGSYHVFGNNGTTPLNSAATFSNNTAASATVKSAIASASDHYPLVADYRLPAQMTVTPQVPARVIVGASNAGSFAIANSAPVQYAIGADTLSYTFAAAGSFTGSGSGSNIAAFSNGTQSFGLGSVVPAGALATGTLTVTGTSQEMGANGSFSQAISTRVVSHAHPSLSPSAGAASLTIDFGTRALNSAAQGLGVPSASFAVSNIADASGFTAGLDLDNITAGGASSSFSTNLGTFSSLAGGASQSFSAALQTSAYGLFSAMYTLALSDENIPGAQATAPLTLNLIGRVAMAGDTNVDGVVNALDFNAVSSNFGQSGAGWADGDFNADGFVDTTDFTAMAQNFGNTYNPNPAPLPATFVPEATLLIAPVSALLLLRRKRATQRFAAV
jgi:hypothetical protein